MLANVEFGREICGDIALAEKREWLVTNGIGGFAGGTIGDVLTRRYHGLLFAALEPPLGRTLLLAKLEATVSYGGRAYALGANRWADGTVDPQGFREVESFRIDGSVPSWSYAFSDVALTRSIWMGVGENTTYVRYDVRRASDPVALTIRALVNDRDYHSLTHASEVGDPVTLGERSACVRLFSQGHALYLSADRGEMRGAGGWYNGFRLRAETERGLDDLEDHYHAVDIVATLAPGESITIVASTNAQSADAHASFEARDARDRMLLARFGAAGGRDVDAPQWIRRLVLAADQFIAERVTAKGRGQTIVAGYPWFGDWGRDTMIALPGLALVTGRADVARNILATFAQFLDRGMLPNRFPDAGEAPEYNTVDATLWFVEAIRRYVDATGDESFATELLPALEEIVERHCEGTRYGIHVDPRDGLLFAGEDGVQLTWMDAKVGDLVITPRTGKAIEINALWHRALLTVQGYAARRGRPSAARCAELAERVRQSFARFWNESRGYCFDVVDGPHGDDASIRPNAVIAASLPQSPLKKMQRACVLQVAARTLVTSAGLRSLAPGEPQYVGRYGGSPFARDSAYHQGTVWPWLLGPYVSAHLAVYGDRERAREALGGIKHFIEAYGVGSIAEIADGDAPYEARGCIAQAWSVSEILRAWCEIEHGTAMLQNGTN